MSSSCAARAPGRKHRIGLALAGGGPFGANYEIGALIALEEALEGLDLNALGCALADVPCGDPRPDARLRADARHLRATLRAHAQG